MAGTGIQQMVLYYFSGTGNARCVAEWAGKEAVDRGIDVSLLNIATLKSRKRIPVPGASLIGFCGPTHGFNYPPIVLHFILRFPRGRGRIFLLNTRAGMKMGKIFTPGLSGMALYLASLILRIKGYRICGMRSIDLPSNWISVHPGIKKNVVTSIFNKRKEDTLKFAGKILDGKKVWRGLRPLPLDLLITPVGILYYVIGRFALAKTFIASRDCTHCNLCVEKCPVGAIRVVDGRCFWSHRCESCMQCMNNCPARAIETAHGFIIGFSILVFSGILVWLNRISGIYGLIRKLFPDFISDQLVSLFNWLVYLAVIFLFYRILHYLMRFRFFERLVVWTSLTHLKAWRRYRSPKNANL